MRKTITISVSYDMHALIRKGMYDRYCSTVSEYLRLLVRCDQVPAAVLEAESPFLVQTANQAIQNVLTGEGEIDDFEFLEA